MAEDFELWDVICDGPFVPTKISGDPAVTVPKTRKEFNDTVRKAIEKNFRVKKIMVCGIGHDEYNRISTCQLAKEIWESLQTAHEGTTQVKQSKIDMLTTEYELFRMKDDESIQDMHTRFTSIVNELHSPREIIPRNKLIRKIISVIPSSWKSKVNVITEAKDLQTLTIDELSDDDEDDDDDDEGYILGVGRIGKSLSHSIKNVYYVNGLKYSLLSVSQICDKGNKVEFVLNTCTVTNLVTGEVVLVAKRYKNIYVADFKSLQSGNLSCLSDVDDDAELWHRRLGHASFMLLTPRTPQQNGVVERENRTLGDMARTMLIDSGIAKSF
nr:uncharacterized protein LOC117275461 [Nicotiana tomentosiformis]